MPVGAGSRLLMRIVIDTSVLVSGIVQPRGFPALVVTSALRGRMSIASSAHLWAEFEHVLSYAKVQQFISRYAGEWLVRTIVDEVKSEIVFVDDCEPEQSWIPDDPNDNWVIQCALTANADYIVSGDRHLLFLRQVGRVRILSPAEFVAEVLDQR
jgi:putative PIN family toxin of toxin-antitoxin system